jgi:hypothetical protein
MKLNEPLPKDASQNREPQQIRQIQEIARKDLNEVAGGCAGMGDGGGGVVIIRF